MLKGTFPPDICRIVIIVGRSAHNNPVTPNATAVFQPNVKEKIKPITEYIKVAE